MTEVTAWQGLTPWLDVLGILLVTAVTVLATGVRRLPGAAPRVQAEVPAIAGLILAVLVAARLAAGELPALALRPAAGARAFAPAAHVLLVLSTSVLIVLGGSIAAGGRRDGPRDTARVLFVTTLVLILAVAEDVLVLAVAVLLVGFAIAGPRPNRMHLGPALAAAGLLLGAHRASTVRLSDRPGGHEGVMAQLALQAAERAYRDETLAPPPPGPRAPAAPRLPGAIVLIVLALAVFWKLAPLEGLTPAHDALDPPRARLHGTLGWIIGFLLLVRIVVPGLLVLGRALAPWGGLDLHPIALALGAWGLVTLLTSRLGAWHSVRPLALVTMAGRATAGELLVITAIALDARIPGTLAWIGSLSFVALAGLVPSVTIASSAAAGSRRMLPFLVALSGAPPFPAFLVRIALMQECVARGFLALTAVLLLDLGLAWAACLRAIARSTSDDLTPHHGATE